MPGDASRNALRADTLGTIHTITNGTGQACYDATFTPYGQEMLNPNISQTCSSNYKFTGYEYDSETGLYYAKPRYYNPRLGRFMSADPLAGGISDPQSLNRYAYVANNPQNLVDPQGMSLTQVGNCWLSSWDYTYSVDGQFDSEDQGSSMYCGFGSDGDNMMGAALQYPSEQDFNNAMLALEQKIDALMPRPSFPPNPPNFGPSTAFQLLCPVNAGSINATLANTPLAGQGANFVATGQQYNLDPRLLVSLAGAETTFGENITAGQYNALNIMYNGFNSPFSSFQSNINAAGRSLTNPRNGYNLTNTGTMYSTYCKGAGCAAGLSNVNAFMAQQGASVSALSYPCK